MDEDVEDSRGEPRAQTVHTGEFILLCQDLPWTCDSISLSVTEAECKKYCRDSSPLWTTSSPVPRQGVAARKGQVWDCAMVRQGLGQWCGFSHKGISRHQEPYL